MTSRRIILDANIIIRAVLGSRVRELIDRYGEDVEFFVPALAFDEALRNLPTIAEKRGVISEPASPPCKAPTGEDRLTVLLSGS